MTENRRDGLVLGLSEDEYHGQGEFEEFALAEFSSSAAKEILKTPAHYEWTYLKGHKKQSKSLTIGTVTHSKVLGVGQEAVAIPEKFMTESGARSKSADARKWAEEQEAAGLIVMTADDLEKVDIMAENVLKHPDIRPALEQEGWPEASVFATDPETGVRCRSRFDFLPKSHPIALDLKSAANASLKGFTRAIDDWSYDVQHGFYMDVAGWAGIDWIEDMLFIVVENVAPFGVNVIRLDREWMEMGRNRAAWARHDLVKYTALGEWPSYPRGVKTASPPPWVVNNYQDEMNEDVEARQ